ncbi:hypothetical protein HYC85_025885 [Camellia sinensis]|uniref:Leucine-rich repeat-containing N-terminal plant-type domain-containing protein n=1 Tax=Camellia sinensis TaxID=4442 RepID=A0A7J7G625_CAMSI|nr:hypothetical protein HYC85_025885 [Camellia sinensis]
MEVFLRNSFVVVALVVVFLRHRVDSEPTQDKLALLAFLAQTPHENRLQWNSSNSACTWVGIQCDSNLSFVYSLRLPGVGLVGQIPANTIGNLTQLRILSLRANRLSGSIPSDFSNLKLLRSLYLQNNLFSGEFPPSIPQLDRLTRLDISSNNFTGSIPFAVNNLTHLTRLYLQNNGFSGSLPSISQSSIVDFNVSNNHLNGSIPTSLSRFQASSFAGNIDLCGVPLPPCNPFFPSPAPSPPSIPPPNPPRKTAKKLSKAAIIAISVGAALILLLLILILILCLRRGQRRRQAAKIQKPTAAARSGAGAAGAAAGDPGTSSSDGGDGGVRGSREKQAVVL